MKPIRRAIFFVGMTPAIFWIDSYSVFFHNLAHIYKNTSFFLYLISTLLNLFFIIRCGYSLQSLTLHPDTCYLISNKTQVTRSVINSLSFILVYNRKGMMKKHSSLDKIFFYSRLRKEHAIEYSKEWPLFVKPIS